MIRRLLQPQADLLDDPSAGKIVRIAGIAAVSLAVYGFTAGVWRSPLMGLYVALKMPLLVACTLCCNGVLNGLLGTLLGGLGFRESLMALLSAFAVAALLLGALSPVTLLLALEVPPADSPQAASAHAGFQLVHVALIAVAGVWGTLSLWRILRKRCATPGVARVTMLAWLVGNGFLGAQFSWILRPFFGAPWLEVSLFRENPMRGSFYETVWQAVNRSTGGNAGFALSLIILFAALVVRRLVMPTISRTPQSKPT